MPEEVRGPLLRLPGVHPLLKVFDHSLVDGVSNRDVRWTSANSSETLRRSDLHEVAE